MVKHYRLFILSSISLLILTGAAPQHKRAAPSRHESPIQIQRSTKSISIDDNFCKGAYQEDKSCGAIAANAAIDQSRYAAWQAIAALIGLAIGTGTLVAAIIAARWAKKAALETERSAAAAETAIDNSRLSEERQSRAYIFVESISLGRATKGPARNQPGTIILLRNTGKTPAFDVLHYSELQVLPVANEHNLMLPDCLERRSETDVPSGGMINAIRSIGRTLTREETFGIRSGSMALFCHGKIEYSDTFGIRRRTTYRNRYSGMWPTETTPLMTFCDGGNEAT